MEVFERERTLGIEVFHRPPGYDAKVDPVVRLTAGEIRRRLAQNSCEPEHEKELHVALPPGSYVPEFHCLDSSRATQDDAQQRSPQPPMQADPNCCEDGEP